MRPATGSTRIREPATCGRATAVKTHTKTPLCHGARPPGLCSVVPRAQGTGPDWGRSVFRGSVRLPSKRGLRAGLREGGGGLAAMGGSV